VRTSPRNIWNNELPMKSDFVSAMAVAFYKLWHGRLHLPGSGWLLRRAARVWSGLQKYPFPVPDVGTAMLDFRDGAAYGMVNVTLGELGNDSALLRAFACFTNAGENVWDVGANVGYLTLSLVRPPFQFSHIAAFEPNPAALKTLASLFAEHPRVSVHAVGLGAEHGSLELQISPEGSPLGSLVRQLPGATRVSVPIRRGDDYAREKNLPVPHLIKIDVEGFEPQVLAGLSETIARNRPIIVIEHIWLDETQIRSLVPSGYQILFLLDDGTATRDFARRHLGANAALIPNEKSECVKHL
jgi:FkbM family methyltransferase